jgi:hypothetical protein
MMTRAILVLLVLFSAIGGAQEVESWAAMVKTCASAKKIHVAASVRPVPEGPWIQVRFTVSDTEAIARLANLFSQAQVEYSGISIPDDAKAATKEWYRFQIEGDQGQITSFKMFGSSSVRFSNDQRLYLVEQGWFGDALMKLLLQMSGENEKRAKGR